MAPSPKTFEINIRLADIEPEIWRRVAVEGNVRLHELHRIIQLVFSWSDYHLYEFEVAGRRFQPPDTESDAEDSTQISLEDLRLRRGSLFTYTYDFGDSWIHEIRVEEAQPPRQDSFLPRVIDGERRGPPEDCGGPFRYMELLRALKLPLEHLPPGDRDLVEWVGLDFDPDEFSLHQADHALVLFSAWRALSSS
jgi:hypothetical protein